MAKKYVSIDMGSKNIKIVEGKLNKNGLYIEKAVIVETPLNSINNGNITDRVMLRSQLKNSLKINNIKTKKLSFTLKSSSIISRELIIPAAEPSEIDTLIEYEIQQYLPIIVEEYVLQYIILDKIHNGEANGINEKLRVMVVAIPKAIIKEYLKLIDEFGLSPGTMDVNFNSTSKLIYNSKSINSYLVNENDTTVIIDMGAESLEINILRGGTVDFCRLINSGSKNIDRKLSMHFNIPEAEAEKLKIKNCDLTIPEEYITLEKDEATYYAKEVTDNWIDEIGRILQYYKNTKNNPQIERIYIQGGGSRLKGIEEYMEKYIKTPVEKVKFCENVVFGKNVDKDEMDLCLIAAGAVIRQ